MEYLKLQWSPKIWVIWVTWLQHLSQFYLTSKLFIHMWWVNAHISLNALLIRYHSESLLLLSSLIKMGENVNCFLKQIELSFRLHKTHSWFLALVTAVCVCVCVFLMAGIVPLGVGLCVGVWCPHCQDRKFLESRNRILFIFIFLSPPVSSTALGMREGLTRACWIELLSRQACDGK